MKACIINILFCFLFLPATAADNYALNDTLYVWARNGLNLREQPDLKGKVIKTLQPGDRVIVREITEKKLTLDSGAESSDFENEHYLLRGKWILIETDSGQNGYLFDVYLLKYPIPTRNEYSIDIYLVNLWKSELSIDTIRSEDSHDAGEIKFDTHAGIRCTTTFGRNFGVTTYEIDYFTIEEGFIFYTFFNPGIVITPEEDPITILKNWANELHIGVEICDIRFYTKGKTLFIEESCSC